MKKNRIEKKKNIARLVSEKSKFTYRNEQKIKKNKTMQKK